MNKSWFITRRRGETLCYHQRAYRKCRANIQQEISLSEKKKREKMKALLHLNHLLRKARREEKKKRKARERAKHDEQA